MQVPTIEVDREEARKRVEEFTAKRRKKLTEMDHALFRGYKALAEGLTLIDVNQAIKQGGHFEDNYCPKLALVRSDIETVHFKHRFSYGDDNLAAHGGEFTPWRWDDSEESRPEIFKRARAAWAALPAETGRGFWDYLDDLGLRIELDRQTIESPLEERKTGKKWFKASYHATVPPIPFHLRPNGDAEKYFILWEVEKWEQWIPSPAPADPLLLERIAHPIYVVVAQWDLSELEKRILESFRR